MSRENVLFAIIGVLFGYLVAFTAVVYINIQEAPLVAGGTQGADGMPHNHPPLQGNPADLQKLQQEIARASEQARQQPDSFEAQIAAADLYVEAENYSEALDYLTRANKLRPNDYDTLVKLGNANLETGKTQLAEQWYTAALQKKPDDVDVRSDLALTYYLRQPPDGARAIAEFRRALDINPNHERTLFNLAIVLRSEGDLAETEKTIQRLERIAPNNPSIARLREQLNGAGRQPGADRPQ